MLDQVVLKIDGRIEDSDINGLIAFMESTTGLGALCLNGNNFSDSAFGRFVTFLESRENSPFHTILISGSKQLSLGSLVKLVNTAIALKIDVISNEFSLAMDLGKIYIPDSKVAKLAIKPETSRQLL